MYHVHTLLLHTCYRIHSLAQAYCNWSTRCSSSPTSPRFRISFWRRPFVPMPSLWTFDSKTPPIRLQFRLPTHKPQESAGACRKTNAILFFCWLQPTLTNRLHFYWQFRLTLFLAAEHLRVVSTPHLSQGATPWPGGPAHKPNCWELGFVLRCMMTEECRHRGGEIRFRLCTLWNIMITYQEDPLITTWKLYCDSQTVPGACRINLILMKGLIRPFHYTCHTCQTEATGHGALPARSGCIPIWEPGPHQEYSHMIPQLLIAKELVTEWLPRWWCVEYDFPCSLQIFHNSPKVRINQGRISSMEHDMNVCKWVFNVSHATRTHCRIGEMIGSWSKSSVTALCYIGICEEITKNDAHPSRNVSSTTGHLVR